MPVFNFSCFELSSLSRLRFVDALFLLVAGKLLKQHFTFSFQKIFGASVHPKYCGWFALRAVVIFKSITWPELLQPSPPDLLKTDQQKIDFLEKFNFHWQDWSFRDVFEPIEKYSELQKLYFETIPSERKDLVKHWIDVCLI